MAENVLTDEQVKQIQHLAETTLPQMWQVPDSYRAEGTDGAIIVEAGTWKVFFGNKVLVECFLGNDPLAVSAFLFTLKTPGGLQLLMERKKVLDGRD